jgi:hypothetical protein
VGAAPSSSESFSIPEAYAEKGWASKIKTQDDLFKQIDNLDSMVGKRQTPGDDAPDEEWDEFFGKIGKPESPDKYELSEPEGIDPEVIPQDFRSKAQKIMHESGLTQKQANKLYQKFLQAEMESAGQTKEAYAAHQKQLDEQFDSITTELFGDKFEEASARVQNVIKDTVPEKLVPYLQSLSETNPQALASVIALTDGLLKQIDNIKSEYGAEDSLGSGGQTQATNKDDVVKKLTEAKAKARKLDPFSPERKQTDKEIDELRKQLQSIYS